MLPSSASNYPRLLMITNACIDDIGYANSAGLEVSTQHNEGEASRKVRIADMCRQATPAAPPATMRTARAATTRRATARAAWRRPASSTTRSTTTSLAQFFGVGSSLDCNAGDQLRFLHEGTMGSVIPQAFWHHYYGVGYAPSDQDRLFTMNEPRGACMWTTAR